MEKTSFLSGSANLGDLLSFFAKKKARLLGKLVPGWTNSKIDSMLLVPNAAGARAFRLPRGFKQFVVKTHNGDIQAFQTGKGPTVLFVHGWGGSAQQFFPLMRGLSQCGFTAISFDHFGHGQSDKKPMTLAQSITTTNHVLYTVRTAGAGLCAVVGHGTGCIAIANARQAMLKNLPLMLISPVFDYKSFFLRKLVKLKVHNDLKKQYAESFARSYRSEIGKYELGRNLGKYSDTTLIAHDESDTESPATDSFEFCTRHPVTKLLITRDTDHFRIINSESVWQDLKSHLNYDDTTINFTAEVIYDD